MEATTRIELVYTVLQFGWCRAYESRQVPKSLRWLANIETLIPRCPTLLRSVLPSWVAKAVARAQRGAAFRLPSLRPPRRRCQAGL
jgi:hypothetical protein